MDIKSIYYTSNSFDSKFPTNSRSSFKNQIDEHEFHYIKNKNIQIGLKELTIENRYNTFETKYGSPHMIIVQNIHGQKLNPKYEKIYPPKITPTNIIKNLFL